MASVREILAEDMVDTNPVSVNVGQTLSKVRRKMEEHNLRTIPVVDGHKFAGMLGYRELIEKVRSDPSTATVDALFHTPPAITADDNMVELADLRINSGRKKFALVGEHDRLTGVIGEREMVWAAADAEELETVSVADLMTGDVIAVNEDTSHETARSSMMDHSISRLPVVDDAGKLVGLLTSNEILQAMIPRKQMTDGDYKHHKESISDIPVSELVQLSPDYEAAVLDDADVPVSEAIKMMKRDNQREAVIVDNDMPVGILTLKDILDHVAAQEAVDMLRVQLTGLDVPEEKAVIHEKVENAVRGGLGRLLTRPDELLVHVKKYEKDGKRHKYSLNFKLSSALGVTTVNAHDWDLLNAVDEGLDELETVVKKEKQKTRDEHRDRERKGKYS